MKTTILTLLATTSLLAQCQAKVDTQVRETSNCTDSVINTTSAQTAQRQSIAFSSTKPHYELQAQTQDSVLVESYLADATKYVASISQKNEQKRHEMLLLHIARKFLGVPYVAKTLENDKAEKLVVNLRELDCTTYVENVLAIYLCVKNGKPQYADYLNYLRKIRYADGNVDYAKRNHYFTEWIKQNNKNGYVVERQTPNPPFTATQCLNINFMSTHTNAYPMLKNNPQLIKPIAEMEQSLSGKTYSYIPKDKIANDATFRAAIHDGDIIAITTKKSGLDTSHIGIAVWHKDGLHLLNASQIHKKVVEEPMTLRQYMQKHPSQTGIRIVVIK